MTNIGIVGAGIAGLHLGLFLRQHGIRLPGLVARVGHTRDREIQLGVNYWDQANNEIPQIHRKTSRKPPPSGVRRNGGTAAITASALD